MSAKTLVWLIGPPAVGKMTVGAALRDLTGLPLFHNHVSIDAVLPIFPYGSPQFRRLVGDFRTRVFEEVADSDMPGLIFTYVWAFDDDGDRAFVERMTGIFTDRGGRAVYAELWADQATRLVRNETEFRLAHKPSKRDVARSRARLLEDDARYRLSSDGDFPFAGHVRVDTTDLEPVEVAVRIARHFDLPAL